jgi:hypothetical protein
VLLKRILALLILAANYPSTFLSSMFIAIILLAGQFAEMFAFDGLIQPPSLAA